MWIPLAVEAHVFLVHVDSPCCGSSCVSGPRGFLLLWKLLCFWSTWIPLAVEARVFLVHVDSSYCGSSCVSSPHGFPLLWKLMWFWSTWITMGWSGHCGKQSLLKPSTRNQCRELNFTPKYIESKALSTLPHVTGTS